MERLHSRSCVDLHYSALVYTVLGGRFACCDGAWQNKPVLWRMPRRLEKLLQIGGGQGASTHLSDGLHTPQTNTKPIRPSQHTHTGSIINVCTRHLCRPCSVSLLCSLLPLGDNQHAAWLDATTTIVQHSSCCMHAVRDWVQSGLKPRWRNSKHRTTPPQSPAPRPQPSCSGCVADA